MAGPLDPVEGIRPRPQSEEARERNAPVEGAYRRSLRGEITAVHRRSPQSGGEHRLDVVVGGHTHTEIVVRVQAGNLDEIVGRHVTVTID